MGKDFSDLAITSDNQFVTQVENEILWAVARDGSRTARIAGKWLGDCSVPRRAAEMMLRQLTVTGRVACLLLPTHPHQVAVCLERMDPTVALIAIVANPEVVRIFQQCVDFSQYDSHLFFAADEQTLRAVFHAHPGLPIPQQFIRLPVTDGAEEVIAWAQKIFSDVAANQSRDAEQARRSWNAGSDRLLAVVSKQFTLWDDAGSQLAEAIDVPLIDTSDARQSASGYIAQKALQARAVVTANVGRADYPDLISSHQPWICWVTTPRVPSYVQAAPQDGIVLIDASLMPRALAAGWPAARIRVGRTIRQLGTPGSGLCLIADLPSLSPPKQVEEFSSWRVVWDAIRKDLPENPHRLAGDVDGYLEKSRRFFGVPSADFPRELFVDGLIAPAYLMGIAKWMIQEKIGVKIFGRGWENYGWVEKNYGGAIESSAAFAAVLNDSAALVDGFIQDVHPVRYAGCATVSTFGRTSQRIMQDCHAAMQRRSVAPAADISDLSDAVYALLK